MFSGFGGNMRFLRFWRKYASSRFCGNIHFFVFLAGKYVFLILVRFSSFYENMCFCVFAGKMRFNTFFWFWRRNKFYDFDGKICFRFTCLLVLAEKCIFRVWRKNIYGKI